MPHRHVPNHLDTPEEILEHYRKMWSWSDIELSRGIQILHLARSKGHRKRLNRAIKRLREATQHWKTRFDVAEQMIRSYRYEHGSGTMVPVKFEPAKRNEIPLSTPYEHREDLKRPPTRYVAYDMLPAEIRWEYPTAHWMIEVQYPGSDRPEYIIDGDHWRYLHASSPRKNGGLYRIIYRGKK